MLDYQQINITIGVICVIKCMILLICTLASDYRKEKLHRCLTLALAIFIPALILNIINISIEGSAGINMIFFQRAARFIAFILANVILILITRYLMIFHEMKTALSKRAVLAFYCAGAAVLVNILIIIVSQFNGMYYYIDESNMFIRGNYYFVNTILALISLIINACIIIAHRRVFSGREFTFLFSYALIPLCANILYFFYTDIFVHSLSITLTIFLFYVGIQNEMERQLKEKENNARIAVMLSQIQPHFLYNSLAVIKHLCSTDPKAAQETVVEFSEYLRGNIDSLTKNELITFEKELHHIEVYLKIEKKRFEDKLNIIFDIQSKDFMIPALTLQPIVENAVRHGITKTEDGGTVIIRAEETEEGYILSVIDDGIGFDLSEINMADSVRMGIEGVRNRLAAMCGGALDISSKPDSGTTAIITIPGS